MTHEDDIFACFESVQDELTKIWEDSNDDLPEILPDINDDLPNEPCTKISMKRARIVRQMLSEFQTPKPDIWQKSKRMRQLLRAPRKISRRRNVVRRLF